MVRAVDVDTVVIGSGAGGLTAALALANAGQKVRVLEQHSLPGGWCHSSSLEGPRAIGVRLADGTEIRARALSLSLATECDVRAAYGPPRRNEPSQHRLPSAPRAMRLGVLFLLAIGCGPREAAGTGSTPVPPMEHSARVQPDAAVETAKPDCPADIVTIRDVGMLRAAIARAGCNGNAFNGHRTALMAAAERGDLAAVDVLLRAGADPNVPLAASGSAEVGKTALWFAISAGRADVVERLLTARADPNRYPPRGLPLLVLAAVKDSVSIARLLVGATIDVGQTTKRGANAMTYANGPSAAMFAYLTSVGVPTDGLSREQIESLRWESEHAPRPDATADEVVRFAIEVIRKTRSARAREDAVQRIQDAGAAAGRIAVPVLVDVVRGAQLAPTDWSRVRAVEALRVIGWGPELLRELARLLDAVAAAPQQLRLALVDLISAAPQETRRTAVQRLRANVKKTRDREARAALDEAAAAIERQKP